MASVNWQKMTKQAAGAMIRHNGKKERVEGNHTNKHIDKNKSELNIYIGADDYNEMYQAMLKRVDEVDKLYPPLKKLKASERIICESLEYKCPQAIYDLGYDSAVKFFNDVHKMFIDFFGAENVHGSCVHFDEVHDYVDPKTKHTYTSLPHAHSLVSCYVEWEEDIKKGGKKTGEKRERKGINGKNFEKRERYNKLNKKIDDYCLKEFGIHFMTGEQAQKKTVELLKSESELAEANLKVQAAQEQLRSEQQAIEELRTEHQQYRELKVSKENLAQNIKVKSGGIFGSKEETVTMSKADFDTILEQSTAYVVNYDKIKVADERLAELEEREKALKEEQLRIEEEKKHLETLRKESEETALKSKNEALHIIEEANKKLSSSKLKMEQAETLYKEQKNINAILESVREELNHANKRIEMYREDSEYQSFEYSRKIESLQYDISLLKNEKDQLQTENTRLKDKVKSISNNFMIALRKFALITNHLKYVLKGSDLNDFVTSHLEATQKFAKEACDKAPIDESLHSEISNIMQKGTLYAPIKEDAAVIQKRLEEERKMEHYRKL